MSRLAVNQRVSIALSELELSYVRSSGPGGQNVNKVNSKAVLRWSLATSPSLGEFDRARLMARLQTKLTGEGDLIIMSDSYRDQGRNRDDCLEKLKELLVAALHVPKVRRATKPSRSSERKAKKLRTHHSEKKKNRRSPRDHD